MKNEQSRKNQARIIRVLRKVHKVTGIALFLFFFIMAITGILLGCKKYSGGYIASENYEGKSQDFKQWLSIDSLHKKADVLIKNSFPANKSFTLDRIDIRKDKGMIKFIYKENYCAVQLDGTTGELLKIENRRADLIEQIHDGSIVDKLFGWKAGLFKLFYCFVMGMALLTFTITGIWMWYGPKRLKALKNQE